MALQVASLRVFGTLGDGLIFCAPADETIARAELNHRRITAAGPWAAHLSPEGLFFGAGDVPVLMFQVNARDRLRLDGAGLLDRERAVERR